MEYNNFAGRVIALTSNPLAFKLSRLRLVVLVVVLDFGIGPFPLWQPISVLMGSPHIEGYQIAITENLKQWCAAIGENSMSAMNI